MGAELLEETNPKAIRPWSEWILRMTTSLHRMMGRSGSIDTAVLLMLLAILLGVCGFIAVAFGVSMGVTQNFDETLLRARAIRRTRQGAWDQRGWKRSDVT